MGKINIVEDEFGLTKQPVTLETEIVKRFTFSNDNGISVQVNMKNLVNIMICILLNKCLGDYLWSYNYIDVHA